MASFVRKTLSRGRRLTSLSTGCEQGAIPEEKETGSTEGDSESTQASAMTSAESDGTSEEEESTFSGTNGLANLRRRRSRLGLVDSRNLLEEAPGSRVEDRVPEGNPAAIVDGSKRFTLRASAPAHRKIRESPLSSDAIFHQVSTSGPTVGSG